MLAYSTRVWISFQKKVSPRGISKNLFEPSLPFCSILFKYFGTRLFLNRIERVRFVCECLRDMLLPSFVWEENIYLTKTNLKRSIWSSYHSKETEDKRLLGRQKQVSKSVPTCFTWSYDLNTSFIIWNKRTTDILNRNNLSSFHTKPPAAREGN